MNGHRVLPTLALVVSLAILSASKAHAQMTSDWPTGGTVVCPVQNEGAGTQGRQSYLLYRLVSRLQSQAIYARWFAPVGRRSVESRSTPSPRNRVAR